MRLGSVQALDQVSLAIEPGQFVSLLGPSGSGKTTMLNVLAGFIRPDLGRVTFDGADVTGVRPHERDLGIVFQNYALFPHMKVADNIGFPLRMRKVSSAERRERVDEALELVGLGNHAGRRADTLSGGQQQRVALARAIVFEPTMMLLDEPLAALDKQLRDSMQLELRRLQRRVRISTLAVTHDQVEALTMADLVAVMSDGHIEQVAAPRELYSRPATTFVATFLGEANLVPVERGNLMGFGQLGTHSSGQAVIRPEHLTITDVATPADSRLGVRATIEDLAFQGPRLRARVRLVSNEAIELTVSQPSVSDRVLGPKDEVLLELDPRVVHVIAAAGDDAGGDLASLPQASDDAARLLSADAPSHGN